MIQVKFNDKVIFTLDPHQRKVLSHEIDACDLEKELQHWICSAITDRVSCIRSRLVQTWMQKIMQRYEMIPTKEEILFDLVISQPDYRSNEQKKSEDKMRKDATFKVQ